MQLEALAALDLSERQISVYHALLQLGPASIRDVATKAGINRGTTYETLKQLATRGIVSYFPRGKRRVFQAEDPERLLQLGESKQQALALAIEVEQLARMYLHCLSVGKPVILDDEEMDRVLLKFNTYGAQER